MSIEERLLKVELRLKTLEADLEPSDAQVIRLAYKLGEAYTAIRELQVAVVNLENKINE